MKTVYRWQFQIRNSISGLVPVGAYVCPLAQGCWGKTGTRLDTGRCSECGASGFAYNNGQEFSADGVRGYRCMECGTIKPEHS